ncbi:MAG: NAD(P)H-dependent oxidoreductase subunit E [Bryobacterales bacterium]|nr:NAD(P)H-dependent oxidoreductase subunit E [Bryobacterales bacterium]
MKARTAATIALAGMLASIAALSADYLVMRYRTPGDERILAELQKQGQEDSSKAKLLDAEHKRITDAKLARRARTEWLAWALIACSAAFVAMAKKVAGEPVAPALPKPVAADVRLRWGAGAVLGDPADLSAVDEIVAREGRGAEAAIPILQAIQAHYGFLPDAALQRVCERTDITAGQIAGTSSFYVRFRQTPVGKHFVRVCHGTACHVSGARQITEELRRSLGIGEGADTDEGRLFTVEEVACLGCCSLAPVLMVDDQTVGKLTPGAARDALQSIEPKERA